MSFKSGVKGRAVIGDDRWWLWWGDNAQDEVNQEDSEQNVVDGMKKGASIADAQFVNDSY